MTVKLEEMRAKLSIDFVSLKEELKLTKDALANKEAELEIMYKRVEQLEMMLSNHSLELKDAVSNYSLIIE